MKQKGFSLIELLVVITILGVLAAIGLTSYRTANMKARDSRRQADIQQMRSALEMWRSDCGEYPNPIGDLQAARWTNLMNASTNFACPSGTSTNFLNTYLGGKALVDPRNQSPYVYTYDRTAATSYEITYTLEADGVTQFVYNP